MFDPRQSERKRSVHYGGELTLMVSFSNMSREGKKKKTNNDELTSDYDYSGAHRPLSLSSCAAIQL